MAKKDKNVVEIGHNSEKIVEEFVTKCRDEVLALQKKRADINAKIAEVRAAVEEKGVPKPAFDAALAYYKKDIDQRKGYDNGYIISRRAMGLPIKGAQLSLFTDEEAEDGNEEAA